MAWFVLARLLFVAAVGYSAYQLQPLSGGALPNLEFGTVMGALIVARRPTNLIGWSFLAAGVGLAIQAFATEYAIHSLRTDPGILPGGRWLAWPPVAPIR